MMKNKRNIFIVGILIVIIAVIAIVVSNGASNDNDKQNEITSSKETEDETEAIEQRVFEYTEFDLVAVNAYYEKELKYFEASLGGEIAYSADYGLDVPDEAGGKLIEQRFMTPTATSVLLFGYPNATPEELGVNSEEEARLVTQFALWRIMSAKTGDSVKSEYIFDMKNLDPQGEYIDSIDRIIEATEALVEKAKNDPYVANPTFELENEECEIKLKDNFIIVGPYKICGKFFDITSVDITFDGIHESAVLCDVEGNEKSEFNNNEEIYIKLANNIGEHSFDMTVTLKGTHNAAWVYGTGDNNDNMQDFCFMEKLEDKLTIIQSNTLPAITGDLQITVMDNQENKLSGIKFQLSDIAGNDIKVMESDSDGKILFEDLIVGEYIIKQLSLDDNYIIMDMPVQTSVSYNEVVDIVIKDTVIEGKLKIQCVDEYNEKYIPGITYELLDEDKNVIDTFVSDENGEIESEGLKKGTYYFRLKDVPNEICFVELEHKFEIVEANLTLVYPILHYYSKGKINITCVDAADNPIECVLVEILDKDKNVVDTIYSDVNGEALSKYIRLGEYYYRITEVPEGYYEPGGVLYDFVLSENFFVLPVIFEIGE